MDARSAWLAAPLVVVSVLVGGCGGNDATTTVGLTVDTAAVEQQADELRAEAEAVVGDLEGDVRSLSDARTRDDVLEIGDRMLARIDEAQARLADLELEDRQDAARDDLQAALADLEDDVARVGDAVDEGDLVRALDGARHVSVDRVRDALDEVRAATDA